MNKHDEIPDPEKIKEILDVVSEKVPGLLKELSNILYSPESAKQYAEAAAIFYKELKNAGMSEAEAYELTSQYLSTLNLGKMMRNVGEHRHND
ncbi:MAG: hypothetical protein QCI00_00410 [Candidatus Thermoplasmatota archaeon]|nr:hypothetical protein [Candidatus Thermoplasmatota archaeon]